MTPDLSTIKNNADMATHALISDYGVPVILSSILIGSLVIGLEVFKKLTRAKLKEIRQKRGKVRQRTSGRDARK